MSAFLSKVMPPTLIAGTQRKHLHYQLKSHPLYAAIDRAIGWLSEYTDICCDLGGADSAAGNEKMVAHWLNTLGEQIKTFTAGNDATSLCNDRKPYSFLIGAGAIRTKPSCFKVVHFSCSGRTSFRENMGCPRFL